MKRSYIRTGVLADKHVKDYAPLDDITHDRHFEHPLDQFYDSQRPPKKGGRIRSKKARFVQNAHIDLAHLTAHPNIKPHIDAYESQLEQIQMPVLPYTFRQAMENHKKKYPFATWFSNSGTRGDLRPEVVYFLESAEIDMTPFVRTHRSGTITNLSRPLHFLLPMFKKMYPQRSVEFDKLYLAIMSEIANHTESKHSNQTSTNVQDVKRKLFRTQSEEEKNKQLRTEDYEYDETDFDRLYDDVMLSEEVF